MGLQDLITFIRFSRWPKMVLSASAPSHIPKRRQAPPSTPMEQAGVREGENSGFAGFPPIDA